MESIKIKCPAKVNLTLEIVNKREDGFHNIKSIMQMISLYDFLTINVEKSDENRILLSGTSNEIPYDEKNLVYKAADSYIRKAGLENVLIEIFIEKNIPVAAGLAGGSTDAAGTIYGLNKIFNKFSFGELDELCASLGSDLNVCLHGGCTLATSRGEVTEKLPVANYKVTLIKPKHLGISAGEAYKKYALMEFKPKYNMTEKMIAALNSGDEIKEFLYNDLERAVFNDYKELQEIKTKIPSSIMSGSGSTYFVLDDIRDVNLNNDYLIINNLKFVSHGVL